MTDDLEELLDRVRAIEVRLRTQGHTEDGRTLGTARAVIERLRVEVESWKREPMFHSDRRRGEGVNDDR